MVWAKTLFRPVLMVSFFNCCKSHVLKGGEMRGRYFHERHHLDSCELIMPFFFCDVREKHSIAQKFCFKIVSRDHPCIPPPAYTYSSIRTYSSSGTIFLYFPFEL